MADIEDQIQKLKEHVPEDKTDDDIRALIESSGGDEVCVPSIHLIFYSQRFRSYSPCTPTLFLGDDSRKDCGVVGAGGRSRRRGGCRA